MCQRVSTDPYHRGQPCQLEYLGAYALCKVAPQDIRMIWNFYTGAEVVVAGLGVLSRSYGPVQVVFGHSINHFICLSLVNSRVC
jgi:hypothetical protein